MPSHASDREPRVLLITEGTYPFHWGGVSTWCHQLLRGLREVKYTLMSVVSNPRIEPQFKLPESVVDFRPIPLWGMREALETQRQLSLPDILRRKRQTTEEIVEDSFTPAFRSFLQGIFDPEGDPVQLGYAIHAMYRFFQSFDFDATLRSESVWGHFTRMAADYFPAMAERHGYRHARLTLSELTTGMQIVYRWLFPLAQPLPEVDIAHAAMAGICTIVAIAAKIEFGAGFLLTEHGIYLRESYLAEASSSDSLFLKLLKLKFARRITELSYAWADQISPCCEYNKRWEQRNGARPDQLNTIYYGADSTEFTPVEKSAGGPPVVVWVGRINPLKDLETLLRAAALVHAARPDVQFRLFGNASKDDELYSEKMMMLHHELGLEKAVTFCGFISKPALAFNQADLVVLSSISEAFPYSILEAMLCAKPVVATAVGGIPEQILDSGIVVEPRNPPEMARAILELMDDPERCAALGRAARARATQEFTLSLQDSAHLEAYARWSNRAVRRMVHPIPIGPEKKFVWESPQRLQASPTSGNGHDPLAPVALTSKTARPLIPR